MANKKLTFAVLTMCLTIGSSAFAQREGRANDRGVFNQGPRGVPRGDIPRGDRDLFRQGPRRADQDHGFQRERNRDHRDTPMHRDGDRWPDRHGERGAGPGRDIYQGRYLPDEYRSRHYTVEHWHEHQLTAPPHGYHWVQIGADYALVANHTGIVVQIIIMQ